MSGIIIGRAINGVSINGDEYLLDGNNKPMEFESVDTAKKFLLDNGASEDALENFNYYDADTMKLK